MKKIVEISNEEVAALYKISSGLMEMSKELKPYRSALSNVLLLLSESLIMDLEGGSTKSTQEQLEPSEPSEQSEPKESFKLDAQRIDQNKKEIEDLISGVKTDIKEGK